ncbi:L-lactate dehydrogenase [Ruminococcus sp. XPD3002]|uniref:L-lactate dehydrogenase n=1 Tax=Ruminococcus sp. XPD3002 TaxID=1452269 RepID=UPI0009171C44|nr:L-lactate dehydrogenase [Ruminococcus flavefaciens]HRU98504.1 L-lactate dehydrogenase [Ruminococcus sp.]
MNTDKRKVVLIGTGMVGMSFAYALVNQGGICNELVLIDVNKERAMGEAMDLNHGLAFAKSNMRIYAGDYHDCKDADIIVIAAGVAQKEGETRLDLLQRNTEVFRSIITPVVKSGFDGIFLVATNPVDIMTRVTYELSRFGASRVIGTGTSLDTARLRYLLGDYFTVDPKNIHAYVMGEHGDSEFVPLSQVMFATKPVSSILEDDSNEYCLGDMEKIEEQVRTAAYKIIEAKRATYYGIGMAITRIVKAILGDENSVLTVSAKLCGEYNSKNVFIGVPCIIGRNGIKEIVELSLTDKEMEKFYASRDVLEENFNGINL